ncbi:hypothetical protein V1512DRAFT_260358 [Lipomyces arxii]|uniref:uncharacterized protein n=1 Tax=Lipomyces arxii TaxID=56418 RepID=UPI0034CE1E46
MRTHVLILAVVVLVASSVSALPIGIPNAVLDLLPDNSNSVEKDTYCNALFSRTASDAESNESFWFLDEEPDHHDDDDYVSCDATVGCDENDDAIDVSDRVYLRELDRDRQQWLEDQTRLTDSDLFAVLGDRPVSHLLVQDNFITGSSKQILQGLLCMLPERAKHYTTCPQ